MEKQNNPCELCIHQSKSWNEDPCNRCGSENNYAWCEDEQSNFLMLSSLREHTAVAEYGNAHLAQGGCQVDLQGYNPCPQLVR